VIYPKTTNITFTWSRCHFTNVYCLACATVRWQVGLSAIREHVHVDPRQLCPIG